MGKYLARANPHTSASGSDLAWQAPPVTGMLSDLSRDRGQQRVAVEHLPTQKGVESPRDDAPRQRARSQGRRLQEDGEAPKEEDTLAPGTTHRSHKLMRSGRYYFCQKCGTHGVHLRNTRLRERCEGQCNRSARLARDNLLQGHPPHATQAELKQRKPDNVKSLASDSD